MNNDIKYPAGLRSAPAGFLLLYSADEYSAGFAGSVVGEFVLPDIAESLADDCQHQITLGKKDRYSDGNYPPETMVNLVISNFKPAVLKFAGQSRFAPMVRDVRD